MDSNNGSDKFFSVYRNSYLKSHINSFNSNNNSTIIESPKILFKLVNKKQYSLLLDLLKTNKRIIIVKNGLSKLLNEFTQNPHFEEIFQLLWENYNQVIKKLNPLKLLLSQKDSTFLFKYIFNKYYLNDISGSSYKFVDLLEYYKSNCIQDNIEIPTYLISLFKEDEQHLVSDYQNLIVSNNQSSSSQLLESLNKEELISILFKSIINKDTQLINNIISLNNNNINNNNINIPTTFLNNNNNNSNYNNSLEIINYLNSNGYLNGFDLQLVLKWIVQNMSPEKEFIFNLIPSDNNRLINYYNEYYYNLININYYDDNIQVQDQQFNNITDTKSLIGALENGYYQAVLDYVEKNGTSELNLSKRWILQASLSRSYSIDWFSKLYEPFIRKELELGMSSVLRLSVVNKFEIFELIWQNYLVNDQLKEEFIKELFSINQISGDQEDQDERNITNNEDESYIPLIEYVLDQKSRFIIDKLINNDNNSLNLLLQHSLIFGSTQIFNKVLSLFQQQEDSTSFIFKINFKFLKQLIKYTDSIYSCEIIEFLNQNNYLQSELYQQITDKLINNNYELFIVSKSIKILFNRFINNNNK